MDDLRVWNDVRSEATDGPASPKNMQSFFARITRAADWYFSISHNALEDTNSRRRLETSLGKSCCLSFASRRFPRYLIEPRQMTGAPQGSEWMRVAARPTISETPDRPGRKRGTPPQSPPR